MIKKKKFSTVHFLQEILPIHLNADTKLNFINLNRLNTQQNKKYHTNLWMHGNEKFNSTNIYILQSQSQNIQNQSYLCEITLWNIR